MGKITFFCSDAPGLKVGPGLPGSPHIVEFVAGYAVLDEADPLYDEKKLWMHSFGCPPIRELGEDEAPDNDPTAVGCPTCGAAFATDKALNGHILGAHRKRVG